MTHTAEPTWRTGSHGELTDEVIAKIGAVEESMACGIGICMTCVIPVMQPEGNIAMLRTCIDGPVMDGSVVEWDKVGKAL